MCLGCRTGRYNPVPILESVGLRRPLPRPLLERLHQGLLLSLGLGALGVHPAITLSAAAVLYVLVWGHMLGFDKAPGTPYVSHSGGWVSGRVEGG